MPSMASPKCEKLIGGFFIKETHNMSGVKIRVRADAAQAQREIGKVEKAVVNLDKRATNTAKAFRNLALGITAAFTGGALTKSITKSADSMTEFGNRVNLVTRDVQKTKGVMDELFKIASRSRGSVDAAAETFNRFGLALQDSNKPVGELLKVTEAVQKAAVISGAGAQSAKAAIVQLGQGLASGQLRGQELNSVLEQMPRLAKSIADGMGIPFGKLREEAMAGKITAEAVYAAILNGADEIDEEFNTLNATVGGLATVFGNEWTRAIANLDKAIGTSEGIKDGIMFATIAIKSFGENIISFATLVSGELLLAKLSVQRFARDVGSFLKGLFSADLDTEQISKNIIDGFEVAKAKVKKGFKISVDFVVEKVDLLTQMFPSMGTALTAVKTFGENITKVFKDLWSAIVGNSYWTGIFDPSHMEPGQTLAIGSSIRRFLDKPLDEIKLWGSALVQTFDNISFEIYDRWLMTVTSIREVGFANTLKIEVNKSKGILGRLSNAFSNASFEIYDTWQGLVTSVNEIGLKPTVNLTVEKLWTASLRRMGTAWDTFNLTLTEASGSDESLFPSAATMGVKFDAAIKKVKDNFNSFVTLLNNTSIVIGAKGVSSSLKENFDTIVEDFKAYLDFEGDVAGALFAGAMLAAFNTSIRKFLFANAIGAALLASVVSLQDNPEFQESVKATARGFGKLLGKYLEDGEGGLVENILSGIVKLASSIGTGFIDGMFGEDFNSKFADVLATSITLVIGAFVLSAKARAGLVAMGVMMAKFIFGLSARGILATRLGNQLFHGMTAAGKKARVKSGAKSLGARVGAIAGKSLNAAMMAGLVQSSADALIDDDAFNGFGETLDGAIGGAALGGQLGLMIAGPLGAAIGAAVGGVGGFLIDALNNPDVVAKLKGIWDSAMALFDKYVIQMPVTLGNNILQGFKDAWAWLSGKLDTVKTFFGFGNGETSSDGSRLVIQPGETAQEYQERMKNFSTGGPVSGPGTGTSDDIPAMLSTGEYVMKQSAVQKFGTGYMDAINRGVMPKFRNQGGPMGRRAFTGLGITGQSNRLAIELIRAQADGREDDQFDIIEQLKLLNNLNQSQVDLLTEGGEKNVVEGLKGTDEEGTKVAQGYAENFSNAFKNGLSEVLHGGDLKEVLTGLLDNFTSSVIDSFASSFTETAMENLMPMMTDLFKGIGNIGGSAGGGFDIGGMITKGISFFSGFGMAQGGTVPSTSFSQAGKDSVPAMLMPGEMVLSKNAVRNMNSQNNSSQQSFNINVQGDVSRQTRKEIVKMMPQIAGGVNAQNKESNFRK